jgi:hypothetical protein
MGQKRPSCIANDLWILDQGMCGALLRAAGEVRVMSKIRTVDVRYWLAQPFFWIAFVVHWTIWPIVAIGELIGDSEYTFKIGRMRIGRS